MNPREMPPSVDPATLQRLLTLAHQQVDTALLLSAGMVAAAAAIGLAACGCRRCGLFCGLLYGVTLCGVPIGHARVLGPCTVAAAAVALVWPGGRKRP